MKPVYITHTSAITPQHQSEGALLQPLVSDRNGRFYAIEPDYTPVIPPMQLRRMSRLLRMGVYTGMDCLKNAGIGTPDGIVTGTAKGSMTDTETFLRDLRKYGEESLNPTPFILSTYNAINGAIALQTGATGYNQTYVHRGSSFELSLYDAQLNLHMADKAIYFLAGSFEELTADYFAAKAMNGYWKQERDPARSLWRQSGTPGTIAGEGAAFFLLSNRSEGAIATLHTVDTSAEGSPEVIAGRINSVLDNAGWPPDSVDMLVLGLNGDSKDDDAYALVMNNFAQIPVIAFKHLCGEYETSGSFALWLTCQYLSGAELPEAIWFRPPIARPAPQRILYYNHYRGYNHNIMLLSSQALVRCGK